MDIKTKNWLTALTIIQVVTIIALFAIARTETIRVRRIEVLGSKAQTVAVLGNTPNDGGVLMIYDGNGNLRASIGLTANGDVAVDLNDGQGRQRLSLQVNEDGSIVVRGLESLLRGSDGDQ